MTITVNGETFEPGCYIDGHLGQYGGPALAELTDSLRGGSTFVDGWPRDADGSLLGLYGRTGSPWASVAWTDDGSVNLMVSLMDEAEDALNAVTVGGYWSWEDGEFFLLDSASLVSSDESDEEV